MARSYLTTKQVLDAVFSRLRTNSAEHRARMLFWLNSVMQQVVNERQWNFLEKTSGALAISGNVVALPDDFGQEKSIQVGTVILTPADIINDVTAFYADQDGLTDLVGYSINEAGIEFHPSATGTAVIEYTARLATYADGDTTVFPVEFLPLFERAMLSAWYEYDVDEDRIPLSFQIDAVLLRQVKDLDNRRRPLPKYSRRGYIRTQA